MVWQTHLLRCALILCAAVITVACQANSQGVDSGSSGSVRSSQSIDGAQEGRDDEYARLVRLDAGTHVDAVESSAGIVLKEGATAVDPVTGDEVDIGEGTSLEGSCPSLTGGVVSAGGCFALLSAGSEGLRLLAPDGGSGGLLTTMGEIAVYDGVLEFEGFPLRSRASVEIICRGASDLPELATAGAISDGIVTFSASDGLVEQIGCAETDG